MILRPCLVAAPPSAWSRVGRVPGLAWGVLGAPCRPKPRAPQTQSCASQSPGSLGPRPVFFLTQPGFPLHRMDLLAPQPEFSGPRWPSFPVPRAPFLSPQDSGSRSAEAGVPGTEWLPPLQQALQQLPGGECLGDVPWPPGRGEVPLRPAAVPPAPTLVLCPVPQLRPSSCGTEGSPPQGCPHSCVPNSADAWGVAGQGAAAPWVVRGGHPSLLCPTSCCLDHPDGDGGGRSEDGRDFRLLWGWRSPALPPSLGIVSFCVACSQCSFSSLPLQTQGVISCLESGLSQGGGGGV